MVMHALIVGLAGAALARGGRALACARVGAGVHFRAPLVRVRVRDRDRVRRKGKV